MVGEIVGLVDRILEKEDKLLEPYFPTMWGLKDYWTQALQDEKVSDKAWEVVRKATDHFIPPRPPHTDYLWGLNMQLYEAANEQKVISGDLVEQFGKFFADELLSFDGFAILNPEVFKKVMRIKLTNGSWILIRPGDLRKAFSTEGVCRDLLTCINEDPESRFQQGLRVLFGGSLWLGESEYKNLLREVLKLKTDRKLTVSYEVAADCLRSWDYVSGDRRRFLELIQVFGADYLVNFDSGARASGEELPERLMTLAQVYEDATLPSSDPNVRKGTLWLPMVGEKMMDNINGKSVSFAGNLIVDVQGLAKEVRSDPLDSLLSRIHQHLHISEMKEAGVLIEGIYDCMAGKTESFEGVNSVDIQKLMSNPDARARLDLVRNQTNPDLSQERQKERMRLGLDMARVASQEKQIGYGKHATEGLFSDLQADLDKGFGPRTVIEIVNKIEIFSGKGKGYIFPVLLAARSYLLDTGVEPPEGVSADEWRDVIIKVAIMTGELSPECGYAWRRKNANALTYIASQCREDYMQLSQVQGSLRSQGFDEGGVQTKYREITSRSMTDLVYRLATS
jgi:hypothetical protein